MTLTKAWGSVCTLLSHNSVIVDRLEIAPGGYSSQHLHKRQFNRFYVESGEITLLLQGCEVVLTAGMQFVVCPGEMHQFRAQVQSVVYEMYWESDIERFSQGGTLQQPSPGC